MKFKDMTLPQLIAGELNIIRNCSSEVESRARLSFLQALMYEAMYCRLSVILDCYSAWLSDIERGRRTWDDDFSRLIDSIIRRASLASAPTSVRARDVGWRSAKFLWYCSDFNRGVCDKESPHQSASKIRGVTREVVHMCATCYTNKKVEAHHMENTPECPYFEGDTDEA